MNGNFIVSVEGNIGSGKSSLLRQLQSYYIQHKSIVDKELGKELIFCQEPVDEWASIQDKSGNSILTKFYENQEKYSFCFQMTAYISRLNILRNLMKSHSNTIIISERCLYTDKCVFAKMLYDSGKMDHIEYAVYNKWFDTFTDEVPISKLIYLKTDPVVANERVLKRNRLGETVPLEYLTNCNKYHDDWIFGDNTFNKKNILVLDGNVDNTKNIINEWIKTINVFLAEIPK